MKIPCDTIARLANLIDYAVEDTIFHTIRLDNGCVIASDRKFMAIEHIGGWTGVAHINVDDVLRAQCVTEAAWSGSLEITVNPALNYTVARSTMGYVSGNIGVFPTVPTNFDRWKEVALQCDEPAAKPAGTMIWHTDGLVKLAKSSPSGVVAFEQVIDAETRPTVIRDIASPDWVGLFLPQISDGIFHPPAVLPGWLL